MARRHRSTGTGIGRWIWVVCAAPIHSASLVLPIPFSSESIISISITIRIYSLGPHTYSNYFGNPLDRVRRKKNLPPVFPPKKFPTNKPSSFTQLDSISIESETGFTCCRSTSIGAGGLGVVL